jgi:hypothetical protein
MYLRKPHPKASLDYPTLDDDLWVIWYNHGGDAVWPSGSRAVLYMSKTRTDALRGWALMTSDYNDAANFATLDEAQDFLREQELKRRTPYHNIEITTVAEIKSQIFGVEV